MTRAQRITKELRRYDPLLYAVKEEGIIKVFKRCKSVKYYEVEGNRLGFVVDDPHFIFALTHNWNVKGDPVEWGILPIMKKIREGDLWNRDGLAEELIAGYDKIAASNERHVKNEAEAFASDFRSQFAKTFNHVNTSTMAKTDLRRKYNGRYK